MADSLLGALGRLAALVGELGVPCALVGGAAISARVRPRFTDDLDLAVALPEERLEELLAAAARHGFRFEETDRELAVAGLVRLRSSGATGPDVDLLLAGDPFLARTIARATPLPLGPCTLPVATLEDLLLMKLEANRPVDLDDALAIKDAAGPALDRAYVAAQAESLGIAERVAAFLA